MRPILLILAGSLSIAWGQAPDNVVIDPRGVVNAFSRMPAPSRAGRGGLIEISGFNLGPPEGAKAPAAEWPTDLGGIQVMINGTAAPVGSANPGRIVAQVPLDAQVGLAEVVVTRGSVSSRPARIFIAAQEPSVRTVDASGYGQPFGTDAGGSLTLAASGLAPDAPVAAYIGGIRADASAAASSTRVGEFDIQVSVPEGARPGDLIQIVAGGRAANATVFRPMQDAQMQYLPLPDGAPELRRLTDTDLNGNYLIGSGAKDSQGCFPAFLFNFAAKKASAVADCLTAANANAVVASGDSNALGALVGPPQGEAPAGISSRVEIFSPSRSEPLSVDLPGAASNLNGGAGGNFTAVLPGTPPRVVAIDSETGEVRPAGAGNAGAAAGGVLGSIDVDGLTHVLSAPVSVGQGRMAVVVGDDAEQPTRARFVVVGAAGAVAQSRDFPEGWLPLLAPAPPNRQNAAAVPRGSVTYDAARRMFFVLSRMPDDSKHGFVAFGLDRAEPRALPFPDGWFAAACTPNIRIFTLDLSRRLVIAGSSVAASEVRTPCTAMGFIQLDLSRLSAPTAVPLPGQTQMSGALGPDSEINDYIFGTDIDAERDTVYVLDGVTASTFTLTLPPEIRSYQALSPIPEISVLSGPVSSGRVAGNAGVVLFDLAAAQVRVLPLPDGFAAISEAGVFPATRKLVARGFLQGNAGSQLLIYDLNSGDLTGIVPNPDGVAFIGPRPAAAAPPPGTGAPGGGAGAGGGAGGAAAALNAAMLITANPKANTVSAVALDADGKQVGVVTARIP